jgi:hypothetical protein
MFERRHFCAVANLLAHDMRELDESEREYVTDKLARLFESHNPRFKPSAFYSAAEVRAPWDRKSETKESEGRLSSDYEALRDDGYSSGVAAGSWVVDGNTSVETAREILRQLDEGDPAIYDAMPSPLSGEWADGPTPRDIFERCEIENGEDDESELLDYWQAGYSLGWETEVVRSCRSMLGLFPSDLRR